MKTIASALIALSLITAIAAPASAFDNKEFWQQQDRLALLSALLKARARGRSLRAQIVSKGT